MKFRMLFAIGTPGVVGLVDSTGTVKNHYRYSPWGGLEDSTETAPNVLKFGGREYDSETHLYYNRARYYDPQLARFISEDPIGQNGGSNQFAYAGDNPIGLTDPTGTDQCGNQSPTDPDVQYGDCSPKLDGPRAGGDGPFDCSDRGPVSFLGAPTLGYSPCGGDIFDNTTGQDIMADAATEMNDYLAKEQARAILNDLLSGDSSILQSMQPDGVFIYVDPFTGLQECPDGPVTIRNLGRWNVQPFRTVSWFDGQFRADGARFHLQDDETDQRPYRADVLVVNDQVQQVFHVTGFIDCGTGSGVLQN